MGVLIYIDDYRPKKPVTAETRANEAERYIDWLRAKYDAEQDPGNSALLAEMIGAAESVQAVWTCADEDFWGEA